MEIRPAFWYVVSAMVDGTSLGTKPIRLFVADAGRHRTRTGYGKNAQTLIWGLSRDPRFEVSVQATQRDWEVDEAVKERLGKLNYAATEDGHDVVLQIGTPGTCRRYAIPSALFTNIDVSGIPERWDQQLRHADLLLAANRSNFEIFNDRGYPAELAQQGIWEAPFKPAKHYRKEGDPRFTFFFVGTFSFRKGVDVLLQAFLSEFSEQESLLILHVPVAHAERAANQVAEYCESHGRRPNVRFSFSSLSDAWMARYYNRADCFVTATRGEGWGLPLIEAMLCGLPVVAPLSTGIKDYLSADVAFPVPVHSKRVDDIDVAFGQSFRNSYGGSGLSYFEVSVEDLRTRMREVHSLRDRGVEVGERARSHILNNFNEGRFIESIGDGLESLAKQKAPRETVEVAPASNGLLRLEIGAGDKPQSGFIHHDIRALPDIEVVCDARSFPDSEYLKYDEVYASNILEHFNRFEVKSVLQEWVRLVRPGGVLKVITPDIREICRQMVEGHIDLDWFNYLCFGGQDYEHNRHFFGFDSGMLSHWLRELGLEIVKAIPGIAWEHRKQDKYCPMVVVWGRKPIK